MIIFTKFHKDKTKIVDFLIIVKLLACALFFYVHPIRDFFFYSSSSGFKLALSHHMDIPIMDQVGIAVSPGSMVQVAVSPILINITQEAFERFEPKDRDCYMSKEIELPHFKFIDDYKYEVNIL